MQCTHFSVQDRPLDMESLGWWGQGQADPAVVLSPAVDTQLQQQHRVPTCPLSSLASKCATTQLQQLLPTPPIPAAVGSPVPLWAPGATGSAAQPAITTGKAVTLQQTSLLSPATNQGQAAALLDRACWYVLLLLMSCCHTLNGDTQESDVTRQRLGPTAHLGAPVLRASSLPLAEMRVSTRDARPAMFSSPGAALALPLTSANVVKSFAEPIFRASHHMRFLHGETGNADEVVQPRSCFLLPG